MGLDIEHLKQWIGKTESRTDIFAATPVQGLAALLDRDEPEPRSGDPIPPCWHWLYSFVPMRRQSELGPDGHPKRGGFLPPVPLPRRMWAGSRLEFERPLRVGGALQRSSRIADVSAKEGRSGSMVFVRVRHEIGDEQGTAVVEDQDIVYRDNPKPGEAAPLAQQAPTANDWARTVQADEVFLFRYSALTLNGHRIHYDRRYAVDVEGYPGLVVHGPLLATLLLDQLRRHLPDATVSRFAFRAMKPTFDIAPFEICGRRLDDGKTVQLWARHADGALSMDATATLA